MTGREKETDLDLDFGPPLEKYGIFLFMDTITDSSCKDAIEFIIKQNLGKPKLKHLKIIICSNGGDISPTFALIDTIKSSKIPVHTVGLGVIASAGLLLFIAGEPGHRVLTPNTSILSHQYSWGTYGKEHELFSVVHEYELTTERMIEHYKKCTGLKEEQIREYLLPPQDVWLSSKQARKLNICDSVKTVY